MTQFNSNKQQKQKLNYEDLKKFLMKEYTAQQANQILAQHAASHGTQS
jgi:hypothetical protein